MIAGVLWRVVLLAIGIIAFGVQFDRQTRRTPAVAESVPELFRSDAQLRVAALTVAGEYPDLGLAEAEQLVRSRPLPAEHLRVLAEAQFAAGRVDQSALTIQYAAQRGWRDPLAQESMLRLALDAGDNAEAARRYAALFLRRDTADSLLEELGGPVLSEKGGEGRQTLVAIVAGGKRWHNQFLGRGSRVMPAGAFVDIVEQAISEGVRFECANLQQAQRYAASRDDEVEALFDRIVGENCDSVGR